MSQNKNYSTVLHISLGILVGAVLTLSINSLLPKSQSEGVQDLNIEQILLSEQMQKSQDSGLGIFTPKEAPTFSDYNQPLVANFYPGFKEYLSSKVLFTKNIADLIIKDNLSNQLSSILEYQEFTVTGIYPVSLNQIKETLYELTVLDQNQINNFLDIPNFPDDIAYLSLTDTAEIIKNLTISETDKKNIMSSLTEKAISSPKNTFISLKNIKGIDQKEILMEFDLIRKFYRDFHSNYPEQEIRDNIYNIIPDNKRLIKTSAALDIILRETELTKEEIDEIFSTNNFNILEEETGVFNLILVDNVIKTISTSPKIPQNEINRIREELEISQSQFAKVDNFIRLMKIDTNLKEFQILELLDRVYPNPIY